MADPRVRFNVRPSDGCPGPKYADILESGKKRSFFEGINKLGNLEIMNDLGLGKVSEGMRTIGSISNSIREGTLKTIPGIGAISDNLETGANWVLGQVGIETPISDVVKDFHPEAVNNAYGSAKEIYDKVRQGRFEFSDIPGYLQDIQNLASLTKGIFTFSPSSKLINTPVDMCQASPFAMDLISFAPKYKFLFVVQFEYTQPYSSFNKIGHAFVVKSSTRPNFEVEYEDVNMYNFRTQVSKKSSTTPVTMRFYDDNWNQAMHFYTSYMQAMSPISNMSFEQRTQNSFFEPSSMAFDNKTEVYPGPIKASSYAASLGALNGNAKSILSKITLFHVYREGRLMNIYNFHNPRITSMELDDVDMADGETGNEVTCQFTYDSVYVDTAYDLFEDKNRLRDLTQNGFYPFGGQLMKGATLSSVGSVVDNGLTPTSQNRKRAAAGFADTSSIMGPPNPISNSLNNSINQVTNNASTWIDDFTPIGMVKDTLTSVGKGVSDAMESTIAFGSEVADDSQKLVSNAFKHVGFNGSIFK